MFSKKEFDEFILKNKVVGIKEEPFKLKSGRLSHWYANCRVLSDTFELLDRTSGFVIDFLQEKGIKFDYVYGVPDGATKLGMMINTRLGAENPKQKMVIGRKEPKEHGEPRDRYFIGSVVEGDKVVVLEDATTTGSSMIDHIRFLREAKLNVVAVVALVNRLEKRDDGLGVAEYLKKEFNLPFHWLSDAGRLLPLAVKKGNLSKDLVKKFQQSYNEIAVKPVKLQS